MMGGRRAKKKSSGLNKSCKMGTGIEYSLMNN